MKRERKKIIFIEVNQEEKVSMHLFWGEKTEIKEH